MAGKTRSKNRKKVKRFPYIEIEGVENCYLDAALLKACGDGTLEDSLKDEFKLIKKAGITTQELRLKELSRGEIIERVSPHLLESYDFYNFLANNWDDILHHTLARYFDGDEYTNFTNDDWLESIKNLLDDEEIPVYAAINTLRFYKNGEIKELVKPLLEEVPYVVEFYRETGIQIENPELKIDWEEVVNEDLEALFDFEDELEERPLLDDELFEHAPEEALKLAAKIILNVSERYSNLGDAEKYKQLYESEKEQVAIVKSKVDELTQEVKSKDSQVQSLSKENRTLTKSTDSLTTKLEQVQKEAGRLGGTLGELRKEKEEVEKEKVTLERRVSSLEKEAGSITDKVHKELKKEFDKKALKMQDSYDEKTSELEKQLEDLQRQLEEEQAKNNELSVELETTSKELATTKKDLEVVEKERNELVEQGTQTPAKVDNINGQHDEEDVMFGFNEEDIEDFVEFDNKPTRN